MNKHPLQAILEETDYVVRSYSGRGMMGRECLAVTLPQGDDSLGLASEVIEYLDPDLYGEAERQDIAEAFRNAREDSIGKGGIVYFPDVEYVE